MNLIDEASVRARFGNVVYVDRWHPDFAGQTFQADADLIVFVNPPGHTTYAYGFHRIGGRWSTFHNGHKEYKWPSQTEEEYLKSLT